jgi:hypothetical protein
LLLGAPRTSWGRLRCADIERLPSSPWWGFLLLRRKGGSGAGRFDDESV